MEDKLGDLRAQIGEIDAQIMRLVARRMEVSEGIAQVKRDAGLPLYQPEQEAKVILRAREQAAPYPDQGEAVARCLMALSLAHQEKENRS